MLALPLPANPQRTNAPRHSIRQKRRPDNNTVADMLLRVADKELLCLLLVHMRHVQHPVVQRDEEERHIARLARDARRGDADEQRFGACERRGDAEVREAVECGKDGGRAVLADLGVLQRDGLEQRELEFRVAADAEDDGVDELGWVLRVAQGFGDGGYVLDVAGVDGEIFVEGLGRDVVGGAQHVDQFLGCPC